MFKQKIVLMQRINTNKLTSRHMNLSIVCRIVGIEYDCVESTNLLLPVYLLKSFIEIKMFSSTFGRSKLRSKCNLRQECSRIALLIQSRRRPITHREVAMTMLGVFSVIIVLYLVRFSDKQSQNVVKPIVVQTIKESYDIPYNDTIFASVWPPFEPPHVSTRPIMRRSLFTKAQKCLLDSPHVPENTKIPLLHSSSYALPSDIEQHYFELLNYTTPMRMMKPHTYANYNGPWLENEFIAEFCCDKSLSYFGGIVPLFVQWTDLSRVSYDELFVPNWYKTNYAKKFFSMLRKDVIYLAVVQHAGGVFLRRKLVHPNSHWNILVLSSGGTGHVALPLLLKELPFNPELATKPRENLIVFAGTIRSHYYARTNMNRTLHEFSKEMERLNMKYRIYSGPEWKEVMESAALNLAPRGHGRTSFRLAECIQMGLVPVYLYSDHEWAPYPGSAAHISNFGYSMYYQKFGDFLNHIIHSLEQDPNYLNLPEKTAKMKQVRDSHYTIKGVIEQIRYFIQDDPRSDLACQRHPEKMI